MKKHNNHETRLSIAVLGALVITVTAQAEVIPPSLNPGDFYRLVFITAGHRDATSSNISDYNVFVNDEAASAGLGDITWSAIASTATVDARINTSTVPGVDVDSPIFLIDGTTQIATNNADLWDGVILNPINMNQFGSVENIRSAITGTTDDGTVSPRPLGGPAITGVSVGSFRADRVNDWIDASTFASINSGNRLYALSSRLQVPLVPEPASLLLLGLCVLGMATRRRAA